MKIIFIPDIHGNINFINKIDVEYKSWHKIFIGDLVDSYEFTRSEQLECVKKVLSMIERGDTQCIFGNHELSYLVGKEMRASGYAGTMDALLIPYKNKMWKLFDYYIYYQEHNLLITHAGLTKYIWNEYTITFENLINTLEAEKRKPWYSSLYGMIGKSRGGSSQIGGPFWCDWNKEFESINGLIQVFGHTSYINFNKDSTGIRQNKNNYNIDCLLHEKIQLLEYENENFIIRNYEK